MFFDDGYHPTSLEKVADAAGYSKGAVYSNFRNKDELCTAVLDEVRAERLGEVLEIVAKPDTPARIDAIREWAQRVIGDPGWTTLEVEFAAHARPNEQLRTELAGRLDGILQMITAALESADTSDLDDAGPRNGHSLARARRRARTAPLDRPRHTGQRAHRHPPTPERPALVAARNTWRVFLTYDGRRTLACWVRMTEPQFSGSESGNPYPPPPQQPGYPPPGQYPPPLANMRRHQGSIRRPRGSTRRHTWIPAAPFGRHPLTGEPLSEKSKVVAGLLQLLGLFGLVGIGRIYLGYTGLGIAQLVVGLITCGIGAIIWGIIDAVLILTDKVRDPEGRPLRDGT